MLDPLASEEREVSVSRSAVSRRFVALSATVVSTYLSRPLGELKLRGIEARHEKESRLETTRDRGTVTLGGSTASGTSPGHRSGADCAQPRGRRAAGHHHRWRPPSSAGFSPRERSD